jgi:hypothetical protein
VTLMVALNVTGWFTTEEVGVAERTTELAPALTVCTSAPAPDEGEALVVKLGSVTGL